MRSQYVSVIGAFGIILTLDADRELWNNIVHDPDCKIRVSPRGSSLKRVLDYYKEYLINIIIVASASGFDGPWRNGTDISICSTIPEYLSRVWPAILR